MGTKSLLCKAGREGTAVCIMWQKRWRIRVVLNSYLFSWHVSVEGRGSSELFYPRFCSWEGHAAAVWCRWDHQDRGEGDPTGEHGLLERLTESRATEAGRPRVYWKKKDLWGVFPCQETSQVCWSGVMQTQLKFMSPKARFQTDMFNFSFITNVLCFCRGYQ